MTDDNLTDVPPERLIELLREARKEAAGYRTQLRDAEAARDTLTATVTGYQQTALRDAATKKGLAATAVGDLESHITLADVLGEDGQLDPAKADAALVALRTERPHLFPPTTTTSGAAAYTGDPNPQPVVSDWADVLRG